MWWNNEIDNIASRYQSVSLFIRLTDNKLEREHDRLILCLYTQPWSQRYVSIRESRGLEFTGIDSDFLLFKAIKISFDSLAHYIV